MIIIRSYDASIVRHSPFSCGEPVLDGWLKQFAGQNEKRHATRTLLALDEREARVAGYVTTVTHQLEPAELGTSLGRERRYPVPAVLIARLAVDKDYQARGVGSLILTDILERLERASYDMGFELIVVDALHEDAACFYLKRGFRRTLDDPLKLFITTRDLRASLAESS